MRAQRKELERMPIKPSTMESKYFTAAESDRRAEVRARLEKAAKRMAERRGIATTLATDDVSLVERIHSLGFTDDSARVFDLLPLILVAWADGRVQRSERASILAILEARGIQQGSDASVFVETLLELPPSDSFIEVSLELLRDLSKTKGDLGVSVVDMCVRVAEASGGILGIGSPISDDEHELMLSVAEMLGKDARDALRARVGAA